MSERSQSVRRSNALAIAVVASAALLYLAGLGELDLWAPDEPRFAHVAEGVRAMDRGPQDWVVLRLNGDIYSQKPPLYYWLAAAAGSPSGRVTELAARLPSALAGIGCVVVTLALGRRLFGPTSYAGLWGAAILMTTFRFAHLARRAQLDVILALLEALAIWFFVKLEQKPDASRSERRTLVAGLHVALGLATLTKGPVALLPLGIMAVYLAWEGRLSSFRRVAPAWAWLLSLGPALAWLFAAIALTPAGFFDEAVVENLFGRFASGTSHARPFYYYLYQLPADFLPWTLLWPLAFASARGGLAARAPNASNAPGAKQRSAWRLLVVWSVGLLVFFSLSAGKRGLYLLPAYPAIALLCGAGVDRLCAGRDALPRAARACLLAFALAIAGGAGWLLSGADIATPELPSLELPASFGVLAIASAIGAIAAAAWLRSSRGDLASAIGAVAALELAAFLIVYPQLDAQKSPRTVALAADRSTRADGRVGIFANRALVAGIAYYSDRKVEELPDTSAVASFIAAGDGIIISRASDLPTLHSAGEFEVADSVRSGRRELVIARPTRVTR